MMEKFIYEQPNCDVLVMFYEASILANSVDGGYDPDNDLGEI